MNAAHATTLVAFIGSHPNWLGRSVSITGLTDSAGNTWRLLTGPATARGTTFVLLSAVYYCKNPLTSTKLTVTATLSNPAPLVMHVFAVSGTDVNDVPIHSSISDSGPRAPSTDVVTEAITMPTNGFVLSWTKPELGAAASAVDSSLDSRSQPFLWAGYKAVAAGSYAGRFKYASANEWQAAIVGLKAR